MNYKTCTKCGETKEATKEFFGSNKKGKYGLRAICKICTAIATKRYESTEEGKIARIKALKKYAHTDKRKDSIAKFRSSEKGKALSKKKYGTPESRKESKKKYYSSDKGKLAHVIESSIRRTKENCTLTHEEKMAVRSIYAECQKLNAEAGYIAYHVDHIMPIAKGGKTHPDNLQILTAEENLKKGARI